MFHESVKKFSSTFDKTKNVKKFRKTLEKQAIGWFRKKNKKIEKANNSSTFLQKKFFRYSEIGKLNTGVWK